MAGSIPALSVCAALFDHGPPGKPRTAEGFYIKCSLSAFQYPPHVAEIHKLHILGSRCSPMVARAYCSGKAESFSGSICIKETQCHFHGETYYQCGVLLIALSREGCMCAFPPIMTLCLDWLHYFILCLWESRKNGHSIDLTPSAALTSTQRW